MRIPRIRFTLRMMLVAVAFIAISLFACDRAIEAHGRYTFRRDYPSLFVQGVVLAVDITGEHVTISIGENDGIVAGHILYLYRDNPKATYIGKVRVVSAQPNTVACGVVTKVRGDQVREGDPVAFCVEGYRPSSYTCGLRSTQGR